MGGVGHGLSRIAERFIMTVHISQYQDIPLKLKGGPVGQIHPKIPDILNELSGLERRVARIHREKADLAVQLLLNGPGEPPILFFEPLREIESHFLLRE